ncbi:MAG: nuclear transport factor 2 family protein [Rhodospirillaceae bacterium]|nr:nuclear transport factor 2 family protein [Rhodospirillaceae bacterium]
MKHALAIAFSFAMMARAWAGPADVVVEAERAFAADGAKRGWIAAFKTYSAPDAIVLRPDPVNAKESLASQPDTPADTSLKWWPVWAGISQSGDLGFTTGPFTIGGDKGFGHYFTVWAKQPDGAWHWIYDGGPRNAAPSPLGPDTEPAHLPVASVSAGSAEAAWAEVGALEETLARAAATDAKTAYLAYLAPDGRMMGSPAQPAVGRAAMTTELQARGATITLKQLGGRAATSGDLVFTYGQASWMRDGKDRAGHYVRIWQKRGPTDLKAPDLKPGWMLVFDEILIKPPRQPS